MGAGAAHPAMNPFNMPANAECRKTYTKDMCARSLEILNRTILVPTHPDHSPEDIADIIHNLGAAARVALGSVPAGEAEFRKAEPLDRQKFDLQIDA
jgi:hypothetical protein